MQSENSGGQNLSHLGNPRVNTRGVNRAGPNVGRAGPGPIF